MEADGEGVVEKKVNSNHEEDWLHGGQHICSPSVLYRT